MKRTHRLRWQAAAIMTVAYVHRRRLLVQFQLELEPRCGLGQFERGPDRVRAGHHPDADH